MFRVRYLIFHMHNPLQTMKGCYCCCCCCCGSCRICFCSCYKINERAIVFDLRTGIRHTIQASDLSTSIDCMSIIDRRSILFKPLNCDGPAHLEEGSDPRRQVLAVDVHMRKSAVQCRSSRLPTPPPSQNNF